MPPQMNQIQQVVEQTAALAIPDQERQGLIDTLKPIAGKIAAVEQYATTLKIASADEAVAAKEKREKVTAMQKTVTTALDQFGRDDAGNGLIARLHALHRAWTGARGRLLTPLEAASQTIRRKIVDYEDGVERAAETERRRLQAIKDEQAAKDKERLEKRAEKAEEKGQGAKAVALQAQAQAVAPEVVLAPARPPPAITIVRVWKATRIDEATYYRDGPLASKLKAAPINLADLARQKTADPTLELPGVTFDKVAR